MITKEELSIILKSERKKRGITCEELAKKCGLSSKGHIARIESGKYDIYIQTLQKVIKELGLEIEFKERE